MQQQSVKPQPRWMAQYPQWPMWLAFGLLTACFIAFVVVFTVAVTRGLKFVEAARGDIMRDMVSSIAKGIVTGVSDAVTPPPPLRG